MDLKAPRSEMVFNAATKVATLSIYGSIGPDWYGGGVTGKSFDLQLKAFGEVKEIQVWIDSPGGNAFEGISIYNTLKEHSARKIVNIIARACSAASLIAMAGDEIRMAENSVMMIHEASSVSEGNASDHRKTADFLETVNKTVVSTYAARTKQTEKAVADMMAAETWMDAKTAVDKGFATHVVPNKSVSAHAVFSPVNQLDPKNFKAIPEWVSQSLSRLAQEAVMTDQNEGGTSPVMQELKPGFTYRLGDDGKIVSEPINKAPENTPVPSHPANTPPVGGTMTAAEVTALVSNSVNAALTAANERFRNITALCTRVGVPEMADKFLADPLMKVENVQAALLDLLVAKNVPAGPGGSDPSMGTKGDPVNQWKADYAKFRDMHMSNGVTEEIYISSMKQQAGIV